MYGFNKHVGIDSKEALNQHITDEQIYGLYLDKVVINEKIIAPRGETSPSFLLTYYDGNLVWRDFGWSTKPRDAVQFVQYLAELEGKKLNYYQAITKILNDMSNKDMSSFRPIVKRAADTADIRIKYNKKLKDHEVAYWNSQRIDSKVLACYNVYSAELWINGKYIHHSRPGDELFVYMFDASVPSYKLYRPHANTEMNQKKFMEVDARKVTQGIKQVFDKEVIDNDSCVITKSHKDVMGYRMLGIPAVAPQAESEFISESELRLLRRQYPNLYINYDPDPMGYRNSNMYSEKYDIPRIFFNDFYVKDLTEFRIEYDDSIVLDYLSRFNIKGNL